VNPDHLWLGTHAQNHADKKAKGRAPRGERQHLAKLTEVQVRQVRELYAARVSKAALGRHFGVSRTCIRHIIAGENWAWLLDVPGPAPKPRQPALLAEMP
jgi:DNA invertase Pin-like site-specific DNA recombinase